MKTVVYILVAAGLSWTGTAKEEPVEMVDKHPVSGCLKASEYRYHDLLSIDDLLRYLPIDESELTVNIAPFRSEHGWVCYEWKSSRSDMEKVLWEERIQVPDRNRIVMKSLEFGQATKSDLSGFQRFDNLGDQAYWKWDRMHGIELMVEVGAARFSLEVKVDATQEGDLAIAVYFARQVLTKCIP